LLLALPEHFSAHDLHRRFVKLKHWRDFGGVHLLGTAAGPVSLEIGRCIRDNFKRSDDRAEQ
jgi:hypothetical protein